jgi:hypothetical protein
MTTTEFGELPPGTDARDPNDLLFPVADQRDGLDDRMWLVTERDAFMEANRNFAFTIQAIADTMMAEGAPPDQIITDMIDMPTLSKVDGRFPGPALGVPDMGVQLTFDAYVKENDPTKFVRRVDSRLYAGTQLPSDDTSDKHTAFGIVDVNPDLEHPTDPTSYEPAYAVVFYEDASKAKIVPLLEPELLADKKEHIAVNDLTADGYEAAERERLRNRANLLGDIRDGLFDSSLPQRALALLAEILGQTGLEYISATGEERSAHVNLKEIDLYAARHVIAATTSRV